VPASLEALLQRSAELDVLASEDALAVNAAILEIDPANPIATNRLGIGLLNADRPAESVEVFERGLAAHPENPIMLRRIDQARRALEKADAAPPPAPKRRRTPAAGPGAWIKALRDETGWTVAPGDLAWVSDGGKVDAEGVRALRADGTPWGEPSWKVGDAVGLYVAGTLRVPVLVEIAEPPRFDPAFVTEQTGSAEDGERWPWVTPVRGIAAFPEGEAPTLTELGIDAGSMQQRSRKRLDADQRERLLARLAPDAATPVG
jgi:hypothetical protein